LSIDLSFFHIAVSKIKFNALISKRLVIIYNFKLSFYVKEAKILYLFASEYNHYWLYFSASLKE